MANKTVPYSVRLVEEDADYIAQLQLNEAITPSDKIRAIIREAREKERNENKKSYEDYVEKVKASLLPVMVKFRAEELDKGKHSELVEVFIAWISEAMAFLLAMDKHKKNTIEQLEHSLANRIFLLFERVLRMGVTEKAPCYDESLIKRKLAIIIELFEIIQSKAAIEE